MRQLPSGATASSRERVFAALRACSESRDLEASRDLYSLVVKIGLDSVCIVADHLIRLLASCSSITEAVYVFNHVQQPSLYTWNSIISAHIQQDDPQGALSLYDSMPVSPDQVTFSCVLKASIDTHDIHSGRHAHTQIILYGMPFDIVVSGTLVHFYSKLGALEEAVRVFHGLPCRDVVSWGAIIEGFLQNGQSFNALRHLRQMFQQGAPPNKVLVLLGLRACSNSATVQYGMLFHAEVCKLGFEKEGMLQSALVEMYSRCGFLAEVESTFERADHIDLVLWSSILGAYVRSSNCSLAFGIYERMLASGVSPDKVTFLFLLQSCGNAGYVAEGFEVHKDITMRGLEKMIVVENALISMYVKCRELYQSNRIFHGMPCRDEVSWTIIITGHINCGQYIEGLVLFGNMQLEGFLPNVSVCSSILIACGNLLVLEEGHLLHEYIIRHQLDIDLHISNALVYMYCSLGRLRDSQIIFDEIVEKDMSSWSSMMLGFADSGLVHGALNLLDAMQQERLLPDKGILMCSLSACGLAGALAEGYWICHLAVNYGVDLDTRLACEMVHMYVNCGTIEDAEAVFDHVEKPDVALWSSLITGFCECEQLSCATRSVGEMLKAGLELDDISYLSLLYVCCELGSLEEGKLLHSQIVQSGFDCNLFIQCSLAEMYMKCASVDDSKLLFSKGGSEDSVICSFMLSHFGLAGNNQMMHSWFQKMEGEGCKQTHGILYNIFSPWNCIGLQMDGFRYFQCMRDSAHVQLSTMYDTYLVELLSQAGQLNEATDFLLAAPNPVVLGDRSLLKSYHVYGDELQLGLSKILALSIVN